MAEFFMRLCCRAWRMYGSSLKVVCTLRHPPETIAVVLPPSRNLRQLVHA